MNSNCQLSGLKINKLIRNIRRIIVAGVLILFCSLSVFSQPVIKIEKSAKSILAGDSLTLSWTVDNADLFKLEDYSDSLPFIGSIVVSPEKTKTYKFTALKRKKSSFKNIKVQVNEPEILYFEGPKKVSDEDSATLKWELDYVEQIRIIDLAENLPLIGEIKVAPDTTKTYRIVGTNRFGKEVTLDFEMTVEYLESIQSPNYIYWGNPANIFLKYKNTKYLRILPIDTIINPIDTLTCYPDTSIVYTVEIIRNNGDTVREEISIDVFEPDIEVFSASREVFKGQQGSIKWSVAGVDSIKISNLSDSLPPQGKRMISPTETTVYQIDIPYKDQILSRKQTVKVREPYISSFKGPLSIYKGESVYLKWDARGVNSCTIIGVKDNLPKKGKIKVKPEETTTYVIEITFEGKKVNKEHEIIVKERNLIKDTINFEDLAPNATINYEIFATNLDDYPDEIKLYVMAVDEDGKFVQKLAPPFGTEDRANTYFKKLIEDDSNGKKLKVENFKVVEIHEKEISPYDINLTLDYSGSMFGVTEFLENSTIKFIENKHKEDRISITKFSSAYRRHVKLTKPAEEILKRFKKEECGGSTALYAGAHDGMLSISTSKMNKQQILFTDGHENSSMSFLGKRAVSAQQVASFAVRNKIKMDIITYGDGVNEPLLQYMATIAGGNYYNIKNKDDILKVMNELNYLLRNYYVITYKPTVKDGEREISLVVNNNSDKDKVIKRKIFIGDSFDTGELEFTANSYWSPTNNNWGGKKPISPPQVVVMYDFDKDIILDDYKDKLTTYIDYLNKNPKADIVLMGHTDQVGDSLYCEKLSMRRCVSVKQYMVKRGVDKKRITIEACGLRNPVWEEEDQKWKAKENRRVEILIIE